MVVPYNHPTDPLNVSRGKPMNTRSTTYVTAYGYPHETRDGFSDPDVAVCSATVERGPDEPLQSARRRAFEQLKTCQNYTLVDPFSITYHDA